MEQNRCMGCMAALEPGVEICPSCAYDNSIDNPNPCLTAGTVLQERYIVGRVMRQNDLITVYLGYDTQKNSRVYVEEFLPRLFSHRDGQTLQVAKEHQPRYKTLLSDMADRWKRLAGVSHKALFRVRELFQVNNTVYCVTAYQKTVTLEEYLEQQGAMEWSEARTLLMPVMSLVSQIHNLGLAHCGISPDNIVVTEKARLKLVGFALPELRTAGTELTPELYAGYSAPEQYSKSQWQGDWTDIYALGATLYRMLMGQDPVSAPQRTKLDPLLAVATQKPEVPENVSDAILKAMSVDKKDRFTSVDQFTAGLLEATGSNTAVFRPQEGKPAAAADAAPQKQTTLRLFQAGFALAMAIVIILVASMATGNNFLYNPPPPPEEPPPPPTMEHNLVGVHFPSLRQMELDLGDIVVTPEYAFNEDVEQGVIFQQSVEKGEELPEDKAVTVMVSRGSQYFKMPNLEGCSVIYATRQLEQMGLEWGDIQQSTDLSVPVGTVVCSVAPGTKMQVGDKVILTERIEGEPSSQSEAP